MWILLILSVRCELEEEHKALLTKQTPYQAVKKKWKPKRLPTETRNTYLFNTTGFDWIKKAECGPLKPPCCKEDPKDPGGYTCMGISIKSNQDLISRIIHDSFNKFTRVSIPSMTEVKYRYQFNSVPAVELIRERYYDKYFSIFKACPFKVAIQLMDSQILSGQAVRLFQRSQRIKEDNLWGPKTEAKCKANPDMKWFEVTRWKRLKKLKNCKYHCKGWFKRLQNLQTFIKKEGL